MIYENITIFLKMVKSDIVRKNPITKIIIKSIIFRKFQMFFMKKIFFLQ